MNARNEPHDAPEGRQGPRERDRAGPCAAFVVALALAPGCTLWSDPSEPQCAANADCDEGLSCRAGYCVSTPWSCLPRGPLTPPETLRATWRYTDFANGSPVEVDVELCEPGPTGCTTPLGRFGSDAEGRVEFALRAPDTRVHYDFRVRARDPAYYPAWSRGEALRYDHEWVLDAEGNVPAPVMSRDFVDLLGLLVGVRPESGRGQVIVQGWRCDGAAENLVVRFPLELLGEGSASWYLVNSVPSTTVEGTGTTGIAGLANALPGVAEIELRDPEDEELRLRRTVRIEPDALTVVVFDPWTHTPTQ